MAVLPAMRFSIKQNLSRTLLMGKSEKRIQYKCTNAKKRSVFLCAISLFSIFFPIFLLFSFGRVVQAGLSEPPHPAVVRVIVHEEKSVAYGSGTLIGKKGGYGYVITNWHVVRDSIGLVTVKFSTAGEMKAAVIALDDRWDLALLAITAPQDIEPVKVAEKVPVRNEPFWIAGYGGDGTYQISRGLCVRYLSPEPQGCPYEMIDLSVRARKGDSGGPIFNSKYELSGVLFGTDNESTGGSHCGRILQFLQQAESQVRQLPQNPETLFQQVSNERVSLAMKTGIGSQIENFPTNEKIPGASQNFIYSSPSSASSFGGVSVRSRTWETANRSGITQKLPPDFPKYHGFTSVRYSDGNTLPSHQDSSVIVTNIPAGSATSTTASKAFASGHSETNPVNATSKENKGIVRLAPRTIGVSNSESQPMISSSNPANDRATIPRNSTGVLSHSATNLSPNVASPVAASATPATTQAFSVPPMSNPSASHPTNSPSSFAGGSSSGSPAPIGTFTPRAAVSGNRSGNTGNNRPGTPFEAGGYDSQNRQRSTQNTNNNANNNANRMNGNAERYSGTEKMPQQASFPDDGQSKYALNVSEMQQDQPTEKYAASFAPAGIEKPMATSKSRLDTIKMVAAVMIIFFVLFHAVKLMAIVEDQNEHK